MKLHFYGTGASEGVPALFCECQYCKKIRKLGGKNYRMRTCVQLDDNVLIDFSMDSFAQTLFRGMDLSVISHLLITHSHEDHLNPTELVRIMPPMAFYDRERLLNVYGNKKSIQKIVDAAQQMENKQGQAEEYLKLHSLDRFQEFCMGDYKVMPLPANHDKREDCMIYVIRDGEKTILYGHDSGMFEEDTWRKLADYRFDGVVLDCTMVEKTGVFEGHMGLPDNIKVRRRMLEEGMASENTKFVLTHFVHTFNPVHERITPIVEKHGFIAAYDGMDIVF